MVDDLVRVSVAEAATLLGVSAQTVRRRIESGELKAENEAGGRGRGWRWMVLLVPGSAEAAHQDKLRAAGSTPESQIVLELRARVASLEGRLDQADRAASEMRHLLASSQNLLEAAGARHEASEERIRIAESASEEASSARHTATTSDANKPRRWWRR